MPPFGPIKRRDLIHSLRQAGFVGPVSSGPHQAMIRGTLKIFLPNPHQGDLSRGLVSQILRQAQISRKEWERL